MSTKPIPNLFIYKKAKLECIGKSDLWIKQGINEILLDLEKQMEETDKAPDLEQLDRIESTLQALKDELITRQP